MGRLPKIGVDYFTHDVHAATGPTLFTVQNSFGNDGYALWFKLLEFMGTQKELYADFSVLKDWEYFVSLARVDKDKASDYDLVAASFLIAFLCAVSSLDILSR